MPILVPPHGPKNCKIALIGEAPGAEEERLRQPFVGPSGGKLRELLAQVGIDMDACYKTNVIKERPPGNDLSVFLKLSRKDPIGSEAYYKYEESLYEELHSVSANVLVAIGGAALWALTRTKIITKRRGSILEHYYPFEDTMLAAPPRKVIPIIHPAALLRASQTSDESVAGADPLMQMYYTLSDLKRIKEQAEFPEIKLPERKYTLSPTFRQVTEYLDRLLAYPNNSYKAQLAFDIEISLLSLKCTCISFSHTPSLAISIPFKCQEGHYFTEDEEIEIWSKIAQVLEHPGILKLAHNAVFDSSFLLGEYGIHVHPIACTMTAHKTLCPEFLKGLDFVTSMLTLEPYYKDVGKESFKEAGDNDTQFWLYNAKDSAVCRKIYPVELELLEKSGNLSTFHHQNALIEPCVYMEQRGIFLDNTGLADLNKDLEAEETRLRALFATQSGQPDLNIASPTQLVEYFYTEKGLPAYKSRKTKSATVDSTALRRIARKGYPEASTVVSYRSVSKMRSSYADIKMSKDERLRGSYSPSGTVTGRLSSSQSIGGFGLNMQTLPYRMRKYLHADPGYIAGVVDLAQADFRSLAYIGPIPSLIEVFEAGEDPYVQAYSRMFDIPLEEVSNEEGSCTIGDGTKSQRFWGKKSCLALGYGLGYRNFALDNELPEIDGKVLSEAWHRSYPEVQEVYHVWVTEALRSTRTLTNSFGRSRKFLSRLDDRMKRQGYGYIPSTNTTDQLNRNGLEYIYYGAAFERVELLNQVHDSIWFQIPLEVGWNDISHMLSLIKDSLEIPLVWKDVSFVIPAEFKVGTCFGELVECSPEDVEQVFKETQDGIQS